MINNKETQNNPTFRYVIISNNSTAFSKICEFCDKYIVRENLRENGGKLNYNGLILSSKFLIVCIDERNIPIAFNSIVEWKEDYYIYQIVVKREHQQKGIGTELLKKIIEIAENDNKNVTSHVRSYNIESQRLFNKFDFEEISNGNNILYILPKKEKNLKP